MADDITTQCCISGGGPAGIMLGYLLARAGIDVVVLEKHADFLRDFRGDTIHPSTLQIMDELGLYDKLLALPHTQVARLRGRFGNFETVFADFSHLATRAKFIALMPQWDFLNFLSSEARKYPSFRLIMRAEVTDIIKDDGRVTGAVVKTLDGVIRVRSQLLIGCDGRHSTVRSRVGLEVEDIGAPMDVLWFRIWRHPDDPDEPVGSFGLGHVYIMINRGNYWQCGYVIAKGSFEQIRERGLNAFRNDIETLAPFLKGRSAEVTSFDDIKLLTVGVDRLKQWYRPGVLCIGDAAHTMSPVGGVGINLAIQDAVAAANMLIPSFRRRGPTESDLRAVQERRERPALKTQALQVQIQNRVIKGVLGKSEELKPPFLLRLLKWIPVLRRIPARIVGLGFLPEHINQKVFASPSART